MTSFRLKTTLSFILIATCEVTGQVSAQSSVVAQTRTNETQREFSNSLDALSASYIKPLTNETVVEEYKKTIAAMSKPRLDAFIELVSICGSSVTCQPQISNYKLKYLEKSEEEIIWALEVCNNVLQPGSGRRADTRYPLLRFNELIKDAVRIRYSQLGS